MHEDWLKEFEYKGFKCHIWKNPIGGFLCGYVDIPQSNPFHRDVANGWGIGKYTDLDVHGGITFTKNNKDGNVRIGFDCGHLGDLIPNNSAVNMPGDTYKDEWYVTKELKHLVNQIAGDED
jgi:hypothetical protein